MGFLCWNARGLGNPDALRRLRFVIRNLSPDLVFLSETRLSGRKANNLHSLVGFECGLAVDSVGKSGGLVLMWKSSWVVDIKSYSRRHIDAIVSDHLGKQWRFSGVYGDPCYNNRRHMWDLLRRLLPMSSLPWCCAGDFNEILSNQEKEGGSNRSRTGMRAFQQCLDDYALRELSYSGPLFTWDNGRDGDRRVLEKLDRVVISYDWQRMFPSAQTSVLDAWGSDHRTLLTVLDTTNPDCIPRRRFRFEPWWLTESDCEGIIGQAWSQLPFDGSALSLRRKLDGCAVMLKAWASAKFGSLSQNVKRSQSKLQSLRGDSSDPATLTAIRNAQRDLDRNLFREERYWKQRSRVEWLRAGDLNTGFFHRNASIRRQKKRICGLYDSQGNWQCSESGMKGVSVDYFQSLFQTSNPDDEVIDIVSSTISTHLSEMQRQLLDSKFTAEEVKEAIFSISPSSAPGDDGFHGIFFQKMWHIVGKEVTAVCLDVLNFRASLECFKEATVLLIPKIKDPKRLSDFRPISLCSVMYKTVTKVVALRMKSVLDGLISPNQSAFVPGRQITDNIGVAFELMHSLSRKNNGNKGWMCLKLDMSKAYDRVEWKFLIAVMRRMRFSPHWCNLICDCLSASKLSFSANNDDLGSVQPSRGLRQGCPLSPYLFLLCAEGFSGLLSAAERDGSLMGFSCNRYCPRVSHLLFADDSLVFGRARLEDCYALKAVLALYEQASGQSINLDKSSITFSPNIDHHVRQDILRILELPQSQTHGIYLGLLSLIGRNKRRSFADIKNKVWSKLCAWKGKLFSEAGRSVLIKAVALALPTYSMSVFKMPEMLCVELEKMMARFFWGGNIEDRKVHWRKWDTLCRNQEEGGLGFKNVKVYNQSLLAKQGWRIIDNPNSLLATVLKGKYFRNSEFMRAKLGSTPYFWRSVLWGRDILSQGLRWEVGNGSSINVFTDRWITGQFNFKPLTKSRSDNVSLKVVDLIDPETNSWDLAALRANLWEVDVHVVSKIHISPNFYPDRLIWDDDVFGNYAVRSGYKLASSQPAFYSTSGHSFDRGWWQFLWSMNIPHKVKSFIWKLFHNSVPVMANLARRGIPVAPACGDCGGYETVSHAIFSCHNIRDIWSNTCFWEGLIPMLKENVEDIILATRRIVSKDSFECFCVFIWFLWKRRNDRSHGNCSPPDSTLLERAECWLREYKAANKRTSVIDGASGQSRWDFPPQGHLKLNFSLFNDCGKGLNGLGAVLRHSDGNVKAAFSRVIPLQSSASASFSSR